MISAFENAFIELELLFKVKKGSKYMCLVIHFDCRVVPAMNYSQEYNRGPLHSGRVDMVIRGYSWTPTEVKNYVALKSEEDFRLLSFVDTSVKDAMEALGDELLTYLKEAGEMFEDDAGAFSNIKIPNKATPPSASILGAFSELFGALGPGNSKDSDYHADKKIKSTLDFVVWSVYKDYKKTFRHLAW